MQIFYSGDYGLNEKLTKVNFTKLEKILYPKPKITKKQIIEYYIKAAPRILSLIANRTIVLTRYPNGVEEEGFYEKDAPQGTPKWVKTAKFYSTSAKRYLNYILVNDIDTLIWLANLANNLTSSTSLFLKNIVAEFDVDLVSPFGFSLSNIK